MALKVDDAIRQLIDHILGNRADAYQFALDPNGTVAAQGVGGEGYPVDVRQLVSDYCNDPSVPYDTRQALQNYTSGQSGPPGPAHNQGEVVQQLQHITYVSYEGDEQITNIIDQSRDVFNNTEIDVDGDVDGDINVNNASATGDGAAAGNEQGDGDLNQVTGDGSQILTGDHATGNTGDHSNVVGADADVSAPLVAGDNSGIVNDDGNVSDNVFGDGNRVLDTDGGAISGPINFGDGAVTGSALTNSQGVVGGDAVNTSGNTVGPGGSLSGVGDSHGGDIDNSTHTSSEISTITADHSIVGTEQGDGDFDQHGSQHSDFLPHLEPVRLSEHLGDGPGDGDGDGE